MERLPGQPRRAAPGPGRLVRLSAALAAALVGLWLALHQDGGGIAASLENRTLDARFALRGPVPPPDGIVLVAIDDRAVVRTGGWPVPRAAIAAAIERLAEAGARLIVFDLILGEAATPVMPSVRDLPGRMAADPPEATPGRRALGDVIAGSGRVVLPYALVDERDAGSDSGFPAWLRRTQLALVTESPERRLPDLDGKRWLVAPPADLGAPAAALGFANVVVDGDGVVRRHPPALTTPYGVYPSLALEAARLSLGLDRDAVTLSAGQGIRLGPHLAALDRHSQLAVEHYGPAGSFPTVSFADLLFDPSALPDLRDRIVIVGATAVGVGDWFATPFTARLPGAELIATLTANLAAGEALRRTDETRAIDLGGVLLLALAGAMLAGRRSILWSALVIVLLATGWASLAHLAFVEARLWLAVAAPLVALLLSVLVVEAWRSQGELRRRRLVERQRANLSRYFAPQVAERLVSLDVPFAADRTATMAVMFVDLVGYSRVAEALPPGAAMAMLREFHELVERAVFGQGGFVVSHMGDGAMTCFGLPEGREEPALQGLRAARDLVARAAGWNAGQRAAGLPQTLVSIGLHVGPVLMGDIGGRQQFEFTVVGDTVNLASRLESLTRQHDAALILSDRALDRALAADPRAADGLVRVGELAIRGRAATIAVWRLPRASAGLPAAA